MALSVRIELMNINFHCLVNFSVSIRKSPEENVVNVFILISSAVPSISCSSYLDRLWDGWYMAVKLLFCMVPFVESVQNSFLVKFRSIFVSKHFVEVRLLRLYSTDIHPPLKESPFFLWKSSDIHMVDNLSFAVYALRRSMLIFLQVDGILLPK